MNIDPQRAQALFLAALEITERRQRSEYLDLECGPDEKLSRRVEALLAAHNATGGFDIESSSEFLPGVTADAAPIEPTSGTLLNGRYKLIEAIGEGGMGSVWMAEQKEPVKRKVAIKLIKVGMDSRQVLARFEAERQALALMDHPNIAKVFDGGMTEQGRPYFVMEYVKGVPLTEYCDRAKLALRDRLPLFMAVCQAVQHAHQKGIIHRDLKPSNILVCLYDGKPVPKVIDFGLAKAMHQSLTDQSLHTAHGMMVGTPLYMSPEQAEHNNLDVDTRTDIYSLGVILYELLTGSTPLERQQMKQAAYHEILRLIKDVDPPKPSTRISGSVGLPSIAAQRSIDPNQLKKSLTGDLDWIVMKALDKERSRRYETANGLLRDVERFLHDEAVEACPPSRTYLLRKYIRRNRGQVIAITTVLLVLLLGVAGTSWGLLSARGEANEKELARQQEAERAEGERVAKLEAQAQRALAIEQQKRAEASERLASERLVQVEGEKVRALAEQQISEAVRFFLQRRLLGQADVEEQANTLLEIGGVESVSRAKRNPTIRELLDRAALEMTPDKIDETFPGMPLIHAEILQTLGQSYDDIGELDQAIGFFQRSLAIRRQHLSRYDYRMYASLNNLGYAYRLKGDFAQSAKLHAEVLALLESVDRENSTASNESAEVEMTPQLRQHSISATLCNLGATLLDLGQPEEARQYLERARLLTEEILGADHPNSLAVLNNLAFAYEETGRLEEYRSLRADLYRRAQQHLGPEHPSTLLYMNSYALMCRSDGRLDEARDLNREALRICQEKLGPEHLLTLTCLNNRALFHLDEKQFDQAIAIFQEVLKTRQRVLGYEHPETLHVMANLANAYYDSEQDDLAMPLLEETLRMRRKVLPANDAKTMDSIFHLARGYLTIGKPELAEPLLEEGIQLCSVALGPESASTLQARHNLAMARAALGKRDAAIELYREVFDLRNQVLGATHIDTQESRLALADAYRAAEKSDLALPLYEEALRGLEQTQGLDHPETLDSLNQLAVYCWELKRLDRSIPLFEESLRRNESKWGRTDQRTLTVVANLGVNYYSAGRHLEGLPLLQEAWGSAAKFPVLRFVRPHLLGTYIKLKQKEPGIKLIAEMLAEARQATAPNSLDLANRLVSLGDSLLQLNDHKAAEQLFRECLAIREQHQPEDWTTFNTRSLLGASLLGQSKFVEAEPLLLSGYEGLVQRTESIPANAKSRLTVALQRLSELYTRWHAAEPDRGHDVKAAEWQNKLPVEYSK